MPPQNLENLEKLGKLRREKPDQAEFDGLLRAGKRMLTDAQNANLSMESRFILGYDAAFSFAHAALRWKGYRAGDRYLVFQVLPFTVGKDDIRVLILCHDRRNQVTYEGHDVERQLVTDLNKEAQDLLSRISKLGLVQDASG
ncbi:MAG: hypothetical protein A3F77_05070 [Betaproteobacteria bacterium RIFCSPLOWO2_12_FULL_67_28]|nr:MAG: hypothetical protein A3F77_05070 [Betaproteobacteria bacterium RIFCSPLOWO2_12_FULL_67_28]